MKKRKKIFILGINGFIGNMIAERLLKKGDYEVSGVDLRSFNIGRLLPYRNFHFKQGDIRSHRRWVEKEIAAGDQILPLAALVTPIDYVRRPLSVFEVDFEENVKIVRYCAKYGKRLIFPSTSEVYGMCEDEEFDENNSSFMLGPTRMQRWIYSCCKQLLERVIWAYGKQENLQFTLFRPFNWIGPRLDSLESARNRSSRVVTQLILSLVQGRPILLVDGGKQKRCFTDVSDGIDCLFKIIENKNNVCDGKIFNIGNPDNEFTVKELAQMLMEKFKRHPLYGKFPKIAGVKDIKGSSFYGEGYQDVLHRKPRIHNARKLLGWRPSVRLSDSLSRTLDYFLRQAAEKGQG